ncbi:MAG: chitobiase/beta-hexosaminidase C-terminal domain-containing protein, partial [Bacteroidia bacterium]|nr:chitobiase/beta-hexosaminidase C-terminal domain-containing protein [Bacteroidia bacterium]
QSDYTFMDTYEPLARGDWAIHRGGAIFMEGAENCTIEDCRFENLGGNAVFMSAYNRNNLVKNCLFTHTGESAVCLVGSPSAVRFYQTWDDVDIYGKNWNDLRKTMDMTPGPKTPDYPENCVVENCIMKDFGDVGKQVAGVFISMSHKIRVSHATIYNCPRAGICINDGTWGGHIIEFCDIWETVRETGEHGPFNAWGRERQWINGSSKDFKKELMKLDAIDPTIVRNNRIANFRKSISAGNWTIDLDDGSSNFEIYNNLNLGSTIKLRDGMGRKVFNNITVGAVPLGWHVWPEESQDEVYRNIFVISGAIMGTEEASNQFIRPIGLPESKKWSNNYDNNLYWNVNYPVAPNMLQNKTFQEWQASGYDLHAQIANPQFVDPRKGDYSVKKSSPALKLGFKNFPMNEFGHQMTRIVPFGGEFSGEVTVKLVADARMRKDGSLRYTLDGSEPTMHSPKYAGPIKLNQSTIVKAVSYDGQGNRLGFTNDVSFKKVQTVVYPNWFSTLLAGKYTGESKPESTKKAKEVEVMGSMMVNIAEDPDLIDASGGYNSGCYIQSIDAIKGKIWLDAGLQKGWVIQGCNDSKVLNVGDLEKGLQKYRGETVSISAVKSYNTKSFKVKIP